MLLLTLSLIIGFVALVGALAYACHGMAADARSADAFYVRLNAERGAGRAARRPRGHNIPIGL